MRKAMRHPAVRGVALACGAALVVAAAVIAVRQVDFARLADAPWWLLPAMAACVILNQTLASVLVCIQTWAFDCDTRITQKKMWQLTAASRLLNYLPMQAGLIGRATYLHVKHGMPVKQAGLSLLVTFGYGVAIVTPLGLVALLAPPDVRLIAMSVTAIAFMVAFPFAGWIIEIALRRRMVMLWAWSPLRLVDLAINAAKTWLAFHALGIELTFAQAVGLKAVGVLIEMLGLTPHGLGLREWAIAAVSKFAAIATAPEALAATLIERGVDAVMTVAMGLVGLAGLRHTDSPRS